MPSKIDMAATTKKPLTPPIRTTRTAQRSVLQLLKTPGYARAQFIRRLISAVLICAAVAVAIGGLRDNPEVAVFSRDIDAGQVLTAEDVHTIRVPQEVIPAAEALRTPDEAIGRVVAAPATSGEIITHVRLIGEELTSFLVPNGHMVPLKLAEPDVVSLLHHGDTVNVVTSQELPGQPDLIQPLVIAEGARVIATSADISAGGNASSATGARAPATVLIALPAEQAQRVASASISQALTVVITGDRAHLR